MQSFFTEISNISKRFFFIVGNINDTFCENDLIVAELEYSLHQHLKMAGYSRIMFYSRTHKLYCYDRDSYNFTKNPKSANAEEPKKSISRLSGPLKGKLKSQSTNASIEPSQTSENILHFGGDENLAFERIDYCMKADTHRTAVIFTNAEDFIWHIGEGTPGLVGRIIDSFINYERLLPKNRNIMIFVFDKGSISEKLEANRLNERSVWKMFKPRLEKGIGVLNIESPAIGEIRNAINYFRLTHGLCVNFPHLDSVCKKIAKTYYAQKLPLRELCMKLEDMAIAKKVLDDGSCDEVLGTKKEKTAMQKLDELIGMETVKTSIKALRRMMENKAKSDSSQDFESRLIPQTAIEDEKHSLHYLITGNPGTGKTTVAHLLGEIYYELGYLKSGHCVKVTRGDLVAGYVGQTAIKTRAKIEEAMGGVLFIDEAYALASGGKGDFGQEAVDTLVEAMTDKKGQFAVVAAGYPKEMELFLKMNVGLPRRFGTNRLHIEDYAPNELLEILRFIMGRMDYEMSDDLTETMPKLMDNWYAARNDTWGNAGEIENFASDLFKLWSLRDDGIRSAGGAPVFDVCDIPDTLKHHLKPAKRSTVTFVPINAASLREVTLPAIEKITDALLLIKVAMKDGNESSGSGFIITHDGYAITCNHVIEGAASVRVRIRIPGRVGSRDSWHNTTIMKTIKEMDLALLKIDDVENLPTMKLQDPKIVSAVSDDIYLISYPFGALISDDVSTLNYSRFDGKISSLQVKNGVERIFVDMQAKRGSSGGAVVSKATNEVVGVLCGSETHGEGLVEEINFIAPIKHIWSEFVSKN